MPAKAGIQNHLELLDSRPQGNNDKSVFSVFDKTIDFSSRQEFRRVSAVGPFRINNITH